MASVMLPVAARPVVEHAFQDAMLQCSQARSYTLTKATLPLVERHAVLLAGRKLEYRADVGIAADLGGHQRKCLTLIRTRLR